MNGDGAAVAAATAYRVDADVSLTESGEESLALFPLVPEVAVAQIPFTEMLADYGSHSFKPLAVGLLA